MKLTKADKNVAMLKFDELVINSLILSMWHAYKNYNFELYIYIYIYIYIKWGGMLWKEKNRVKFAV